MSKLHIYEAGDGWRWRLKARNGRIVAAATIKLHIEHATITDDNDDE